MSITQHAGLRMRQRGIPELVVDLLLQFGASERAGDGSLKYFFDKPARRKIKAYVGPMAGALEVHMDTYAVVGPAQQVITVGHRVKRISRG